MNTLLHRVACLATLLSLTAAVTLAKTKTPPDVLVVADVLAKEPDLSLRPEPGKPIYYFVLGKLERDLGSPYGGVPSPDPQKVHAELVKAMASQGYVETKVGGPSPHIILVVSWGQANLSTYDLTEQNNETGEQTTSTISLNSREMAQLVGADKASRAFLSSSEADQLTEALNTDRLYLFVGALDANALRKKEKKLLWRTRFSIDGLREDLTDNLGLMFASAAPYFGRSEEKPVVVTEEIRRASVKLGELQFIDDKPATPETAPKK